MKRIKFVTPLIIIYFTSTSSRYGTQHQKNVIGSMNNIADAYADGGNVEEAGVKSR
jgi:hypothetical protein